MKKGFGLYFFTCFCFFAVITPNLQLFLEARGWGFFEIGLLQGVYQLIGVTGPLLVGRLADKTGKYRPFLILGYLFLFPCFLLLSMPLGLWLAMLIMGIIGIALKSIIPLSDALLSRSLKDPELEYGQLRIWGSLGFLVFGFVMDIFGLLEGNFQRSFLLLIGITVFATLISIRFLPSSREKEKTVDSDMQKDGPLPGIFWLMMILLFFAWFANTAYFSFYSLFLKQMTSIKRINIQWGLGALFEIPLIFMSGYLIRRWGIKNLLILTLILLGGRLALYGFVRNSALLTASQLLHAVTFGLLHSLSVAVVNRFVPLNKKAMAMAIYSALVRGGSAFIGSALGGWISKEYGLDRLFSWYALIPLVPLLILCILPGRSLDWKTGGRYEEILADSSSSDPKSSNHRG